jgi:vacuolar protein sorting-associated protein 13D
MFAIQANLNEIREQRHRRSWEFALHRARDARLYTDLYFQRVKGALLSLHQEVLNTPTAHHWLAPNLIK